jgi:hypothetical protein
VTVFAISTGLAVLAWIGLALGLLIAVVVVVLLQSVVRPVLEIRSYADDILEAGVGIATNLDGVDELERTRELATAVPALAVAYLNKLQGSAS